MGLRVGFQVARRGERTLGVITATEPLESGAEPCFGRVIWADGTETDERLRDLESVPPPQVAGGMRRE